MPSITIATPTGRARQKDNERRRWRLVGAVAAFVILAGATVAAILLHRQTMRASAPTPATLIVTSVPSDVVVEVDGKRRGRTPTQFAVTPGDHHLTFQGSQVGLAPIARLLGEPAVGPLTRAVLSAIEGLFFGFGVTLGLTHRPR